MPTESTSFAAIRLGLFFVLALLINCVMDGLPNVLPVPRLQICLIPFTLTFLIALYYFLHPEKLSAALRSWLGKTSWRSCLWLSSLFVAAGFVVFIGEVHHFHQFGYRLYPVATACIFGAGLLALLYAQSRRHISAGSLLLIVVTCYLAIEGLSIFSFPLSIRRSDMFAMIQIASADMAHGHNPYHYFASPDPTYPWPAERRFCAYLPLMLGAYIPGVLLHIDLRWIATACMIMGAALVSWAAKPEHCRIVAATLGIFLLCNYLTLRHDLYLQVYWLVLIITSICMCRGRLFTAAVAMGAALATSQLTLTIFPFLLLHAWQKEGCKKALQVAAVLFGTAACIIGPYAITNPHGMFYGIFLRYYGSSIDLDEHTRPMNLVYWVAHVIQPEQIKWIQFAALVALFGYAVLKNRCRDGAGCLAMMMPAYLSFIMMNVLLDGYFYLTFLILAVAYLCTVNEWWRGATDATRGKSRWSTEPLRPIQTGER